ncbi:MAG: V-type ATPase 116kDa subunit family protein [Thermoprotei archaeon]
MPPVIVNKPVEMVYINIITPRSEVDRVVNVLHEFGAIHVERLGEKIEEYVRRYERINNLIDKINNLLSYTRGVSLEVNITRMELESIDLDTIEKDVMRLYSEVEGLIEKQRVLEERIRKLRELESLLIDLPREVRLYELAYKGNLLRSITIRGRTDAYKHLMSDLRDKVLVMYAKTVEQTTTAILVCLTRFYSEVLDKAKASGFYVFETDKLPGEISTESSVGEILEYVRKTIIEYSRALNNLAQKIVDKVKGALNDLGKYLVILDNMKSEIEALLSIKQWKHLTLIGGWIPKKSVTRLEQVLREKNIPFYLEYRNPVYGKDEPPTLLENPPVIRWFEPIVKFIGLPRYWEWDPTPIIAYSFALFFGIMLGDMGYAIAIVLSVLFILDKLVSDPTNRDYRFFKNSLIVSSIVGFLIGFLSGSIFGVQIFAITDIFSDPLKFLVIALLIGLIHVNISHGLTLIKSFREGNLGIALSEIGLFVTEAFGIPYIMYSMLNTPLPGIPVYMYNYFMYAAFFGIALIIAGMIKSLGGLGLLMWIFSLTGLLGDVLSYSRLAGVGLATIYLGASFNTIAMIAFNGLKTVLPIEVVGLVISGIVAGFVLFFGHLLNTVLSAIGGFIHGLRLCFVEFLSKFYEGTGYPFEPLQVVLRRRIVIE